MANFKSEHTKEELKRRWDEYTSPARFAGSDDHMDLIFVAKRSGDRVKLLRRARTMADPFSCVFRGKICSDGERSSIKGIFTKRIVDYFSVLILLAIMFFMRSEVIAHGDDPYTINVLIAASSVLGLLLLYNSRRSKRYYADFIARITDKEHGLFLSKREEQDRKSSSHGE